MGFVNLFVSGCKPHINEILQFYSKIAYNNTFQGNFVRNLVFYQPVV